MSACPAPAKSGTGAAPAVVAPTARIAVASAHATAIRPLIRPKSMLGAVLTSKMMLMRRFVLAAALVTALHAADASGAFHGSSQPLPAPLRHELRLHLWHPGCPVGLGQLRLLTISYHGFDHALHTGQIVVNAAAARSVLKVFGRLYQLRFPIRQMDPLHLSGDDTASFECRDASPSPCAGSSPTHHWSEHAFGEAIDLNPVENPYTGCGITRERASIPYLNRSNIRPGMVTHAVVSAFESIGWGWGGWWTGTKDYMHFSVTGH